MPGGGGGGSEPPQSPTPFVSAASGLVDEAAHPLEQLEVLDEKVRDLERLGDLDAVVECRIKQKALYQVLVYLYGFPLQPLVRAQADLAEAYAAGGYFRQAHEHLARAREVSAGGIYDDGQCQRLQVDLLVAEGTVRLLQEQLQAAQEVLLEAARLVREVYGEMDARAARIHEMLGRIARDRGSYGEAIEYVSAAWEVREWLHGAEAEETLRLRFDIATLEHLAGHVEEAMQHQRAIIELLERTNSHPMLYFESATKLARWLETSARDQQALEVLEAAERIVTDNFGAEDSKTVDVKRDAALINLKLGSHAAALQQLNDVHYYERRLYGSQSTNVARTLKALGTVHMVHRDLEDAEQCFLQALRIFDAAAPQHAAIVKDIHTKLGRISAMAKGSA